GRLRRDRGGGGPRTVLTARPHTMRSLTATLAHFPGARVWRRESWSGGGGPPTTSGTARGPDHDDAREVRGVSDKPAAERHVPVLADRCLELLAPAVERPGAVLVDATLGMGGHSELALRRFPELRVVGIDRDPQAIELAGARLAGFGDRFTAVHAVYDDIDRVVAEHAPDGVAGVLLDLGVSSLQLDEEERGFAYSRDAPLDMRMDPTRGSSAADLLATADVGELRRILRDYGEERFAGRIAAASVRRDAPHRGQPGQAHVPGAAHRRQRRARRPRADPAAGHRGPRRRWPHRRPGLPLAGGPGRQAGAGPRGHLLRPTGSAGRTGDPPALPAPPHPRRGGGRRGRGRRQPPRRLGATARRRTHPTHPGPHASRSKERRMSAMTARTAVAEPRRSWRPRLQVVRSPAP